MPENEYEVKGTDKEGEPSQFTARSGSVEELVERLRSEGMRVSEVSATGARRLFEPRKVGPEEFAVFNAELAAACKRGVPLPGALRALSRDMPRRAVRRALEQVAADIESGADVAEAFSRQAGVFPPGYVALVQAGLKAGDLAGTFLHFAGEARLTTRVRHSMVGAIAYPLLVMFVGTLVMSYVGWFIFPEFKAMTEDIAQSMLRRQGVPFIFIFMPVFRWAPVLLVAAFLVLALVWLFVLRGSPRYRSIGALLLFVPVIGRYLKSVSLARFCRTLASALKSHVPTPEAISLGGLASGNAAVQDAAEYVRREIEEGRSIHEGVSGAPRAFPPALAWMLSLGEKRGEIVPALEEYATLMEERARQHAEIVPMFVSLIFGIAAALILALCIMGLFSPLVRVIRSLGEMGM